VQRNREVPGSSVVERETQQVESRNIFKHFYGQMKVRWEF
jgi:hypothetical protein